MKVSIDYFSEMMAGMENDRYFKKHLTTLKEQCQLRVNKINKRLKRIEELASDDFEAFMYKTIFTTDKSYDGHNLSMLTSAISRINFILKKLSGDYEKDELWELQYRHATELVEIDKVVRMLTNSPANFDRDLIKCPFHDDSTASLKVYKKSNRFHCFGCQANGSPIDFVMLKNNVDFKEAVGLLWGL